MVFYLGFAVQDLKINFYKNKNNDEKNYFKATKEDIEYYKVHKKHLPRKYVYKYELKNASFQRKFALIILPILCICPQIQ